MVLNAFALLSEYAAARCGGAVPDPTAAVGAAAGWDRAGGEEAARASYASISRSLVGRRLVEALLEQEACYNLGRAMHHLGLAHLAVPWYDRALALEAAAVRPLAAALKAREETAEDAAKGGAAEGGVAEPAQRHAVIGSAEVAGASVAAQAAHNLALIYRKSGSAQAALAAARCFLPVL